MKTNLITNCLDIKESYNDEIIVFCPFCLFINEIEKDYSSVPMIWCEGCGCKAVLDLRNPVQVNNDFKLENEPLLDAQNKNRTLNCGISYEYIKSDFKFLFEVPLFYINRISTRDFYLFPTSEEYDKTDSIIFLNLKNSLENKNLYNYFYISEILKKLEMYFQFMKILFGNHTEKVINALNEEVKNFSDLQGDFHDLTKNKDNQTLKWYVVNEFFTTINLLKIGKWNLPLPIFLIVKNRK